MVICCLAHKMDIEEGPQHQGSIQTISLLSTLHEVGTLLPLVFSPVIIIDPRPSPIFSLLHFYALTMLHTGD